MKRDLFEKILYEQNRKVFNYLLKMLRQREDAEDVLQETFAAFYQKMESVNEESHLSYLYRTAHNKALNLIKLRKKRNAHSINYAEMEHLPAEEKEEDINENMEILKQSFSQLPPKYAIILEMQFYQKMSYKEIARVLETTERAVDSRLVRAKRKLKKIISQETKKNEVSKDRGEKNENERMQIFA